VAKKSTRRLRVTMRRAGTIQNRGTGLPVQTYGRYEAIEMDADEYADSIRSGRIRETDVLHAQPIDDASASRKRAKAKSKAKRKRAKS
jgi:hypothetical protein